MVVSDEQDSKTNLNMQPLGFGVDAECIVESHPKASGPSEQHGGSHDSSIEPPLHDLKNFFYCFRLSFSMVHKKPWQIKKPCEPRYHEYDVKNFNPDHCMRLAHSFVNANNN